MGSAPGGRPYDTTYAAPIIVNVNGTRLLIQGASDGVVYAIKAQTGEPVWKYEISKRGINTGVAVYGTTAILTHSEENLDSNEMGMMVAVDATAKAEIKKEQVKWSTLGWQGGFSSPVLDGDRLYQLDNSANLAAFDVNTGKQLWLKSLGTIQKASPVFADGKLYVELKTESSTSCNRLQPGLRFSDEDQLGTAELPEAIHRICGRSERTNLFRQRCESLLHREESQSSAEKLSTMNGPVTSTSPAALGPGCLLNSFSSRETKLICESAFLTHRGTSFAKNHQRPGPWIN